eukprot:g5587.t1
MLRMTIQTKEEALALTLSESQKLEPKLAELERARGLLEEKLQRREQDYYELLENAAAAEEEGAGGTTTTPKAANCSTQLRKKARELEVLEKRLETVVDKQYVTNVLLKFINADPDNDTETRLEMGRLLAESLGWNRAQFANLLKATGRY